MTLRECVGSTHPWYVWPHGRNECCVGSTHLWYVKLDLGSFSQDPKIQSVWPSSVVRRSGCHPSFAVSTPRGRCEDIPCGSSYFSSSARSHDLAYGSRVRGSNPVPCSVIFLRVRGSIPGPNHMFSGPWDPWPMSTGTSNSSTPTSATRLGVYLLAIVGPTSEVTFVSHLTRLMNLRTCSSTGDGVHLRNMTSMRKYSS